MASTKRRQDRKAAVGCLAVLVGVVVAPIASLIAWWVGGSRSGTWTLVVVLAVSAAGLGLTALLHAVDRVAQARHLAGLTAEERETERAESEAFAAAQAEYSAQMDAYSNRAAASDARGRTTGSLAHRAPVRDAKSIALSNKRNAFPLPSGPLRPDGSHLVGAFAELQIKPTAHRMWLSSQSATMEGAGREVFESEDIVHVAVAQTGGIGVEGIVVTTSRLGVIGKRGTQWTSRGDVIRASWMPSVRGRALRVSAVDGEHSWWEVRPPEAALIIAATLNREAAAPRASSEGSPSVFGSTVSHTTAKFLGGSFVGNTAISASPLAPRLRDGATVKVSLTDRDELVMTRMDTVLGRYQVAHTGIHVDQAAKIGRGLRPGRLAGTAAATLLLGPVGLAGLAASTARRVQEAFALAIEDGDDWGVFALSDAAFGRRLMARQRTLGQDPRTPGATTVETASPHSAIDEIERLAILRDKGAITEDEYGNLKAALLRREYPEAH